MSLISCLGCDVLSNGALRNTLCCDEKSFRDKSDECYPAWFGMAFPPALKVLRGAHQGAQGGTFTGGYLYTSSERLRPQRLSA